MKTKWKFGDLTLEEVKYGFGWQLSGNPSSSTIVEVLDRLEEMFYNMEECGKPYNPPSNIVDGAYMDGIVVLDRLEETKEQYDQRVKDYCKKVEDELELIKQTEDEWTWEYGNEEDWG